MDIVCYVQVSHLSMTCSSRC